MTATRTPNLAMQLPADGDLLWAEMIRGNFSTLDALALRVLVALSANGQGITLGGVQRFTWPDPGNGTQALEDVLGNGSIGRLPAGATKFEVQDSAGNLLFSVDKATGNITSNAGALMRPMNVNPKAIVQAIYMTAAASGSTGIWVPANANYTPGTGNFTLHLAAALPGWTPAGESLLLRKFHSSGGGNFIGIDVWIGPTGYPYVRIFRNSAATTFTATAPVGAVDGTAHKLTISVARESASTAGSVTFMIDGAQLGSVVPITAAATVSLDSTDPLYLLGSSATRTAGAVSEVAMFNRALSISEVHDLCLNGVEYSDKFGNQTEIAVNGSFTADANWTKQAGWTIAGGVAVATSAGTGSALIQTYSIRAGVRYRVKFTISNYVSGALKVYLGSVATSLSANADGTYVQEIVAPGGTNLGVYAQYGPTTLNVDDFSCVAIGAVLSLPPEGIQASGQWLDASGNANHATMPASGWLTTRRQDTTKRIGLATAADVTISVPAGWAVEKIIARNTGGVSQDLQVGTTTSNADLAALQTLTAGSFATFAVDKAFSMTAATSIYINNNSASAWASTVDYTVFFKRID